VRGSWSWRGRGRGEGGSRRGFISVGIVGGGSGGGRLSQISSQFENSQSRLEICSVQQEVQSNAGLGQAISH
jgi:hypothetical protein